LILDYEGSKPWFDPPSILPAISFWNWIVRLNDTDPVIREFEMQVRHFYLRHMTRYAPLFAHRTGGCHARLCLDFFRARNVAGEAFRVIISCLLLQLVMRVMTGDATHPTVIY
jgi:hypothetical protein